MDQSGRESGFGSRLHFAGNSGVGTGESTLHLTAARDGHAHDSHESFADVHELFSGADEMESGAFRSALRRFVLYTSGIEADWHFGNPSWKSGRVKVESNIDGQIAEFIVSVDGEVVRTVRSPIEAIAVSAVGWEIIQALKA